ncbi:hypothetical protein J6590_002350 [Homalodisca vitripennis]|nr:hypothetical protein J6590_002350 [Homalodisca vitripennis]
MTLVAVQCNVSRHLSLIMSHDTCRCAGDLTAPVKHSCDRCGRCYSLVGNLRSHQARECGKEPTLLCRICPYRTHRSNNLKRHYATRHSHVGDYVSRHSAAPCKYSCSGCGRDYSLLASLKQHQARECGKEPPLTCHMCTFALTAAAISSDTTPLDTALSRPRWVNEELFVQIGQIEHVPENSQAAEGSETPAVKFQLHYISMAFSIHRQNLHQPPPKLPPRPATDRPTSLTTGSRLICVGS